MVPVSLHLIDLGWPVVFCHIPKTGGTSIREGRRIGGHRLYNPDSEWPVEPPVLAFVRDPFDRAESCWRDFRFLRPRTRLDFLDFLASLLDADPERIDNPASPEHHAAPMVHPVHGLQHAVFIGRYQSLQNDFNTYCDLHGLDRVGLPHLRDAGETPEAPLTRETVALVERIYGADYDYLARLEAAA